MAVREVQSPDGRVWRVRRCWLPRRPWLPRDSAVDAGRGYWWLLAPEWTLFERIVYPALMLVCDIAWFAISFPFSIAGRFLGLRPWRVRAATIGKPRLAREVEARGLDGSRVAIDELAAAIASGR